MKNRKEEFKTFYKNSLSVNDIDPNIWMSNYLVDRLELNENQILWFCFLNSITYHLPTAYLIINEYPDLELVDEIRIKEWWNNIQSKCPFQRDKLKQRKYLPETIISYQKLVKEKGQKKFFDEILNTTPEENFNKLWNELYKNIYQFGRFSVWNWSQMLKQVAGYEIEPTSLFLGDDNAESHTHGLCYALGKDEWAKKERYTENGKRKKIVHKFSKEDVAFLNKETDIIIKELQEEVFVDKFMIETISCAFKKIFRDNDSRYVGYYLDRQAEDIISIENNGFYGVDWSILWDAREELIQHNMNNKKVDKEKFKLSISEKINFIKNKNNIDDCN
jgi:hypothetical protein